jgi:methylenetetrahydrofolate reductase (NADPH)
MVKGQKISASIELSAKQVLDIDGALSLIPAASDIYLVDTGSESDQRFADAAQKLRDQGYNPVPHFAARRFSSLAAFDSRLSMMAKSAAITQVLAIGGGLKTPAGPFSSTMDMFESGLFQRYGIQKIGIAGHPEGSPDFSEDAALSALRQKQKFAQDHALDIYIITQFGFNGQMFIDWALNLQKHGITMPVQIGVSGPAKITSLLKFAMLSGVGNSMQFLRRNAMSITTLASGFDPEVVVAPIERHWQEVPAGPISQIHVFAFGGAKATSQWLIDRGTWKNPLS